MANSLISESEIKQALNLNKRANPDGHFPSVFKALSSYIVPALSHIFKYSIQSSQIPDNWHRPIITAAVKAPT